VVLVSFGLVLDVCWGADTHAQSESALLRVRIRDRNVERAVADGTRRSLTFRSLIERVEHSRGLLYIFKAPYLADKMEGCVVLDGGGAWEDRYLRMMIKSGLDQDRMIAVIGHESQHVLEILSAATRGSPGGSFVVPGAFLVAPRHYETSAALEAEARIAAELREEHNRVRVRSNSRLTRNVAVLAMRPASGRSQRALER